MAHRKTVRRVPLPPRIRRSRMSSSETRLTLEVTQAVTVHHSPSSKRSMDVR
jgi:hypothetical protein